MVMMYLLLMLLMLVGVLPADAARRHLYVDGINGNDNNACTENKPCKRIDIAVQVLRSDAQADEGTIHLYGNISINESLQIDKSLTIRGYRNATISSSKKSQLVFWTKKQLSLFSLAFEGITLLKFSSSIEHKVIVIHNCQFNRTRIEFVHEDQNRKDLVRLFITSSNFTESTVKVVGTRYWWFTLSESWFSSYSEISGHVMHVEGIGRFAMDGTVFSNIQTTGACLNVKNSRNVSIANSKFVSNSAAREFSVLNVVESAITIANTEFSSNKAKSSDGGGFKMERCNAIIENTKVAFNTADQGGGGFYLSRCHATIRNTTITSNTAAKGKGGGYDMSKCTATITDTIVVSNIAPNSGGGGVSMYKCNGTIINNEVISNTADQGGGFYIMNNNATNIVNTKVVSNTVDSKGGGFWMTRGHFTVLNTEIISNVANIDGGGIYMSRGNLTVLNSKVNSNHANRFGGSFFLSKFYATILNTKFESNSAEARGGALALQDMRPRTLIMNVSFINNIANEGGAIHIIRSQVMLTDCLFMDNSAHKSGGAVFASSCMGYGIMIARSFFKKCFADIGGAMTVENSHIKVDQSELRENWAKTTTGGMYVTSGNKVKNQALIQRSSFFNNYAPSLFVSSHKISITKSTFRATTDSPVNHLNLNGFEVSVRSINVELMYPKLPQSNTELGFMSLTSQSNNLNVTELNISCSQFFHVKVSERKDFSTLQKTKANLSLTLKCATCSPDEFTLANSIQVENYEQALDKKECKPCPAGAICNGYIRVLDGFWGGRTVDEDLVIWQCPKGYCCTSQTVPCENYNTCASGREGELCGRCKDGYLQSFLTDDCILKGSTSKSRCNFPAFLMFFKGVAWAYTLIFTFLPALVEKLKKIKSKTKGQDEIAENIKPSDEVDTPESVIESDETPIGAVVTLVIYFFQLVSLVSLDVLRRNNAADDTDDNKFTKAFLDAFNFRFTVYSEMCPMDDLTLVVKLFLNLGIKASTVLNIFLVFIVYKAIVLIKCKCEDNSMSNRVNKSDEELQNLDSVPSSSSADVEQIVASNKILTDSPMSLTSHLKIGLLKLLKVNFTSSMVILLQLVHCETLRDKPRLYLFADHICYVWWQWLIFVLIIPTLVLFPMSFGMALNRLKARTISTTTFLTSCVIPFAFYFKTKISSRNTEHQPNEEEEKCTKVILEQEEELFDDESKGVRWPVLQLYRMLVIVLVNTFVLNTIFRSLWFSALFVAFATHDRDRMPYKSQFLNQLQWLTSACLFLVNLCSVPSAFSSVANITSIPNMDMCLTILGYFKLLLYAIVLLSFPMWKIREKVVEHIQRRKKTN